MTDNAHLLKQHSFVELGARQRARALLDAGSFRELIDPFARMTSPWLPKQGVVPQADDGVVVAKGAIGGQPVVVCAIEGNFQGGSMGEVGGAKMAGALELAAEDNRKGIPTAAVLLLETGGVRLQEANLGLAAIAEIHAAIVDLRRYQPVIGVVAGSVGCFGGMSIAAGLCSYLVVTQEARLGLNGPQVIEQEAGIEEYDSRDRPLSGASPAASNALPAVWWMHSLPMTLPPFNSKLKACCTRASPSRSAVVSMRCSCSVLAKWIQRRRSTPPPCAACIKENSHEQLFDPWFAVVHSVERWRD